MTKNYNQRLFDRNGLRRWYHLSRFKWLKRNVDELPNRNKIIELGCFDGRSLEYISAEKIEFYHGYDAGWEGGLNKAISTRKAKNINFTKANCADEIITNEYFNLFIALETLEHLNDLDLRRYLNRIKPQLYGNYHVFVSVPNEIGMLFFVKTVLKWILYRDSNGYSFKEFIYQTFGRTEFVQRNEHKGFSHKKLCEIIDDIFDDKVNMVGVQFPWLPLFINPTIGLILKRAT